MSDSGRTMREQCRYCGRSHDDTPSANVSCRQFLAERVESLQAALELSEGSIRAAILKADDSPLSADAHLSEALRAAELVLGSSGEKYSAGAASLRGIVAKLEAERDALIGLIPKSCVVNVCEGLGPENKDATLAVSVSKMATLFEVAEKEVALLRAERDALQVKANTYGLMAMEAKRLENWQTVVRLRALLGRWRARIGQYGDLTFSEIKELEILVRETEEAIKQ